MRFVETPVFTAAIQRHLDDEQYRQFQIALMLRRNKDRLSRGLAACARSGGRPLAGQGGGLQVIYYWAPADHVLYMVYAYSKSVQGDLTPAQTRQLSRMVRKEFK